MHTTNTTETSHQKTRQAVFHMNTCSQQLPYVYISHTLTTRTAELCIQWLLVNNNLKSTFITFVVWYPHICMEKMDYRCLAAPESRPPICSWQIEGVWTALLWCKNRMWPESCVWAEVGTYLSRTWLFDPWQTWHLKGYKERINQHIHHTRLGNKACTNNIGQIVGNHQILIFASGFCCNHPSRLDNIVSGLEMVDVALYNVNEF